MVDKYLSDMFVTVVSSCCRLEEDRKHECVRTRSQKQYSYFLLQLTSQQILYKNRFSVSLTSGGPTHVSVWIFSLLLERSYDVIVIVLNDTFTLKRIKRSRQ